MSYKKLEAIDFDSGYHYDKKKWDLNQKLDGYYIFRRKDQENAFSGYNRTYYILESLIQYISQVSDHDFLFIKPLSDGTKEMKRFSLADVKMEVFRSYFRKAFPLSNDILLFEIGNREEILGYKAYSIKQNQLLDKFQWLSSGFDIVPMKDDESGHVTLSVTKKLSSNQGEDYIQFLLDGSSFEPVSSVYSSLRGKDFSVQNVEDIQNLIYEDRKYIHLADRCLLDLSDTNRENTTHKMFAKLKN